MSEDKFIAFLKNVAKDICWFTHEIAKNTKATTQPLQLWDRKNDTKHFVAQFADLCDIGFAQFFFCNIE